MWQIQPLNGTATTARIDGTRHDKLAPMLLNEVAAHSCSLLLHAICCLRQHRL
jgi:hypothetical protein